MALREAPPPDSEIPDLDLGPLSRAGSASDTAPNNASSRAQPAKNQPLDFDAQLDDDFLGSEFDLATDPDDVRSDSWPDEARVVKDRPWPTGTTPEPGSIQVDPEQVQPLCGWGPAPTIWWQTPFYAYLVFLGRRDLTRQLAPVTQDLQQVEARRDECLATLATEMRDKLGTDPSFSSALQLLQASELVHGQARTQLRQIKESSANELQTLDTAIAAAQASIAEFESDLGEAQGASQEAELDLKREQARLQRLSIERRNIEQLDANSAAAIRQLAEISEYASAVAQRIEIARTLNQSQRVRVTKVERLLFEKQSELVQLDHRKSVLNRTRASQVNQASAAMTGATQQQSIALAELGRAVLQARGRVMVDDAILGKLNQYDQAVSTLSMRKQVYSSALESYDRQTVRRGLMLAGAFVALLVISFVWRLFN